MSNALPPLIPRSVLFGNPDRLSPRLSPDGRRLAYIAPRDGVLNVYVRTVGQSDNRPVTSERERPVRALHWTEDGRRIIYPQDFGGDENFHLFLTDVETGETRDITPFPGARATLVALEPRFPDAALVGINKRDPHVSDVYRCDLTTGELTLIAQNPGDIMGWDADADFQVRAGVASLPDGGSEIRVRESDNSEWRTLLTVPFGESAGALTFDESGKGLYVLTDRDVNTQRLYLADVSTGALTLVHAREDVDVSGILTDPDGHVVRAVGYNRSRQQWVALEPAVAADLEFLKSVDDGDLSVVSQDRADEKWVVAFSRDNGPANFYLYDRPARRTTFLFSNRPALEGLTLATMAPIDIPARDGLIMPCYLTLPPNVAPKNLPLVLNVHGGPWARDMWGLLPEVQWLANRGYAVLQVNYRGSAGFGKAHLNAGNREWGARMHDDLVDAVQWAVAEGYADPARVAIYGGSYGGYATLVGLTFTPDLFVCGVDIVGVSNLLTFMDSIPPYWAPMKAMLKQRIGDPETEVAFLKSRSPFFNAERIVRPLLIAQGANDPRVVQAESDQIAAAVRRNGKEVTYLLFPDEGHGFARPENRMKFYAAAEAFLATYLGGRVEPAHPGEEPPLVSV